MLNPKDIKLVAEYSVEGSCLFKNKKTDDEILLIGKSKQEIGFFLGKYEKIFKHTFNSFVVGNYNPNEFHLYFYKNGRPQVIFIYSKFTKKKFFQLTFRDSEIKGFSNIEFDSIKDFPFIYMGQSSNKMFSYLTETSIKEFPFQILEKENIIQTDWFEIDFENIKIDNIVYNSFFEN